jgi:protein transport protein SEC13
VSWSVTGNLLAVSSGDSTVTLWKESLDHEWQCISTESDHQQLQQQGQQL